METKDQFKFDAIKSIDDTLTMLWLNALLHTNHYYPKMIYDMEKPEDFVKWKMFLERLK